MSLEQDSRCWGLKVSVQTKDGLSLEEIRAFLKGNQGVRFEGQKRAEIYAWVDQALHQQDYRGLGRTGRGLVRQYLGKMTGLSRAQVTRLITQYLRGAEVKAKAYRRRRFPSVYTPADAELLASVDEAHETVVPANGEQQLRWLPSADHRGAARRKCCHDDMRAMGGPGRQPLTSVLTGNLDRDALYQVPEVAQLQTTS